MYKLLLLSCIMLSVWSIKPQETFLFDGKPAKLESEYKVHLEHLYTVPETIGKGRICQTLPKEQIKRWTAIEYSITDALSAILAIDATTDFLSILDECSISIVCVSPSGKLKQPKYRGKHYSCANGHTMDLSVGTYSCIESLSQGYDLPSTISSANLPYTTTSEDLPYMTTSEGLPYTTSSEGLPYTTSMDDISSTTSMDDKPLECDTKVNYDITSLLEGFIALDQTDMFIDPSTKKWEKVVFHKGTGSGGCVNDILQRQHVEDLVFCGDFYAIGHVGTDCVPVQLGTDLDGLDARFETTNTVTGIRNIVTGDICPTHTDFGTILIKCGSTIQLFGQTIHAQEYVESNEDWCLISGVPRHTSPCDNMIHVQPKEYYCSFDGTKYLDSPVDVVPCGAMTFDIPGDGSRFRANIDKSACLEWNTVTGEVDIFQITVDRDQKIMPADLLGIDGMKVAFKIGSDYVIDESLDLYGVGNSGHDCIRYDMDKRFHDPGNCMPISLTRYPVHDYFSGNVHSSGLSRLMNLFTLVPNNTVGDIELRVLLKPGNDYPVAIIEDRSLCPHIESACISACSSCQVTFNKTLGHEYGLGAIDITDVDTLTLKVGESGVLRVDNGLACGTLVCGANGLFTYPSDERDTRIERPSSPDQRLDSLDQAVSDVSGDATIAGIIVAIISVIMDALIGTVFYFIVNSISIEEFSV